MKLYISYQQTGGQDEWVPIHADSDMSAIKPAFTTVLACDKLINKQSTRETVDSAKYLGPLYFDLDNESDLEGAIADARKVVNKLYTFGLTSGDVQIYLSGKKGLHILVPSEVFREKLLPVSRLPAIYKEIAFKVATESTDFAVYSGRSGRMFRTCYRQRDNGNWKVPVTAEELMSLTVSQYEEFCKAPRTISVGTPTYRPSLAILYEGIYQQISAAKRVKVKPTDAATLRKHLPTIHKVMGGKDIKEGVGFNKIAIQLGVYAREAKISEDELVIKCSGLIANHAGDGYRYNTPRKRELEIRRMYNYIDDGVGYEYSIHPIQALLNPVNEFSGEAASTESGEEETIVDDSSGLFTKGSNYYVATEQGDKHILDARFLHVEILNTLDGEKISCISAKIQIGSKIVPCALERSDFTSSTSLHKAVSLYGASFTGSDIHARYIFTHMLRESQVNGKTVYATEREGLDVLKIPMSAIVEARTPFVVWSDGYGVRIPKALEDKGLDIRFVGYPSPEGVLRTDLALTPNFLDWIAKDGNKQAMLEMLRGLASCQDANILAKLIGWMSAAFYTQLFRAAYTKFPLLHINGAAGSGKTETTEALMHMFYYNGDPIILNPSSTAFAITTAVASSASIPIIIDEYKPSEMGREMHSNLKSMFRTAYNGSTVARGGGNRQKDSFNALSQVHLSGPIIFIAEAIEQETATLERCVPVTMRSPVGRMRARYSPGFHAMKEHKNCLSLIGQHFAATIVQGYSVDRLREEFDPVYLEARREFMPSSYGTANKDPEKEGAKKDVAKERVVFGHSVVKFGLSKFCETIFQMFPDEKAELEELYQPIINSVYQNIEDVAQNTMPEYVKVFQTLSDMSRFRDTDQNKLNYKYDYEVGNIGDKTTLNIVGRLAYSKYRSYCRSIDSPALFGGIDPFMHSLRNSPIFLGVGPGTAQLKQEVIVLDYELLIRQGMPVFSK
jgi:hypothetical protein